MATCAPRKEEVSLEVEAVPLETRAPLGVTPLGSVETPSGAAVGEIPTASATLSPYSSSAAAGATAVPVHATSGATWRRPYAYVDLPDTYVGVPVEREEGPPPPATGGRGGGGGGGGARPVDPRIGVVRGDITLGVDGNLEEARVCASESARKDNDSFGARFAEEHARIRVAAEAREFEVARFNAKRSDAQGLDMRPHPGNRLEPPRQEGFYGEKAFAFEGGGSGGGDKSKAKEAEAGAGAGAGNKGEGEGDNIFSSGGYQPAEYHPEEYDCAEYTSVYETTTKKKK